MRDPRKVGLDSRFTGQNTAKAFPIRWTHRLNGAVDRKEMPPTSIRNIDAWKKSKENPKRRWLNGIKEDVESLHMIIQEATRISQFTRPTNNPEKDLEGPAVARLSRIASQVSK